MRSRVIALWALAATLLAVGGWALLSPATFYTSFPFERGWVAVDGPYNEHLIRDFGGLNLALSAATAVAAFRPRADLIRLAAGANLAFGLPHFVYHASHLEIYGTADAVANMITLGAHILVPLWLLARPVPPRHTAQRADHAAGTVEVTGASGTGAAPSAPVR